MKIKAKVLRSVLISLLAIWMIAASGGMALYYHLCECTGKDHLALSEVHHCHCTDANASSGPSCCASSGPVSSCPVDATEHCCKTAVFFLIKTDHFVVSNATMLQHTFTTALLHSLAFTFEEQQPAEVLPDFYPEEPPPPTRKTCLTYLGAFHSSLSA